MKTIVLKNTSGTFFIELKVDLFDNSEAFTVMTIEGRSDIEDKAIANIQQLPSSISAMETYAIANGLLMDIVDIDPAVATINTVVAADLTPTGNVLAMTSTGALAGGNDTVAYSQPVVVVGGNGPLTFSVTTGALPSGLVLDTINGVIHGTPVTVENPTFEITAIDAFGQSDADATLSINIQA